LYIRRGLLYDVRWVYSRVCGSVGGAAKVKTTVADRRVRIRGVGSRWMDG
jgi:hypothetical protein